MVDEPVQAAAFGAGDEAVAMKLMRLMVRGMTAPRAWPGIRAIKRGERTCMETG